MSQQWHLGLFKSFVGQLHELLHIYTRIFLSSFAQLL